ncbi:hypothetical protein B0H10DRAFT_518864 [Mycena sp. CBHHK59/15]|nr:hypothetical protein B0H10DRAFT_518864 [Mycena sp. CBHHK59/15]
MTSGVCFIRLPHYSVKTPGQKLRASLNIDATTFPKAKEKFREIGRKYLDLSGDVTFKQQSPDALEAVKKELRENFSEFQDPVHGLVRLQDTFVYLSEYFADDISRKRKKKTWNLRETDSLLCSNPLQPPLSEDTSASQLIKFNHCGPIIDPSSISSYFPQLASGEATPLSLTEFLETCCPPLLCYQSILELAGLGHSNWLEFMAAWPRARLSEFLRVEKDGNKGEHSLPEVVIHTLLLRFEEYNRYLSA